MIDIVVGPNLVSFGTFALSWHGFFSFIAVASAVFLVGRWSLMSGMDQDDMYSLAIWVILGGILGARAVHVIDTWSSYSGNPGQIIAIWSGGIGIWGGRAGRARWRAAVCLEARASHRSDRRHNRPPRRSSLRRSGVLATL